MPQHKLLKLHPLLKRGQEAPTHLHLKGGGGETVRFGSYLKSGDFNKIYKLYVRYFEIKLHIHTLGTSETCFTSCKE